MFETNSSNVHALVLPSRRGELSVRDCYSMADGEVKDYCGGNVVVFDVSKAYEYYDVMELEGCYTSKAGELFKFLARVSQYTAALLSDDVCKVAFFKHLGFVGEIFSELGLRYEFDFSGVDEDSIYTPAIEFADRLNSKEDVAAFLFGPMSCAFSVERDDWFTCENRSDEICRLEADGYSVDVLGSGF